MTVLPIPRIPFMDKALRASSPKLLFVAVVPSVSTTEASDTINVNSRASLTVRLPQLQVDRKAEDFFRFFFVLTPRINEHATIPNV